MRIGTVSAVVIFIPLEAVVLQDITLKIPLHVFLPWLFQGAGGKVSGVCDVKGDGKCCVEGEWYVYTIEMAKEVKVSLNVYDYKPEKLGWWCLNSWGRWEMSFNNPVIPKSPSRPSISVTIEHPHVHKRLSFPDSQPDIYQNIIRYQICRKHNLKIATLEGLVI